MRSDRFVDGVAADDVDDVAAWSSLAPDEAMAEEDDDDDSFVTNLVVRAVLPDAIVLNASEWVERDDNATNATTNDGEKFMISL